jgi:(2Fe-2S) ferredoxin
MPSRERYLLVCTNRRDDDNPKGSCAQKGSEEVAKRIKEALKTQGLAGRVRSCTTSCLDLCEIGIAVVQEPEHVAYGYVTLSDVDAIVAAAGRGEVVERLVVHRGARATPGGAGNGKEQRSGSGGERP